MAKRSRKYQAPPPRKNPWALPASEKFNTEELWGIRIKSPYAGEFWLYSSDSESSGGIVVFQSREEAERSISLHRETEFIRDEFGDTAEAVRLK